jgi:hypothetical protein
MDIRRRAQIGGIKKTSSGGGSTGGTYTVNLNEQWEKTTAISNPDSTLYDGVYRSSSNYNVNNGVAIMYIIIKDCSSFKMYIRSYAESNYDYVMVSQLDKPITGSSSYSDTTLVKAHTRGNQQSGTALSNYTLVEFTGISSGEHTITVVYRKDSSVNNGDDRGYVLIEKSQAGSGDSGGSTPDNPGTGGDTSGPINTSNYTTILALEDGLTAKLSTNACQYCIDGDGNWLDLPAGTTTQSINSGQTLSFRGNLKPTPSKGIGTFTISKKCNLEGNCMSLLFGDDAVNNNSLSGKNYAFYDLFRDCTTIIQVSESFLPATTLDRYCYYSMFLGCTSLTVAPELPATTLANFCYQYMFYGCRSLTKAPELPATTLVQYCYNYMFYGCSSLTTAPELPATTLASNCYYSMFKGCTSLTTAPSILPATTLASNCYANMFYGCSKLNYIKMLATNISASNCLSNWVSNVSSTGTFVKNPAMASLPTGESGIPIGWTVVDNTYSIIYTSSDGNIVTPYSTNVFGANIVSNNYIDGQGIISFDGPVTTIGNNAFLNCKSLTSVTIPDSVTTIGYNAFKDCSRLTSVNIPDGVTTIETSTFSDCSSLTSVNIPDSITKIRNEAFYGCNSLTSVTIPDSVTSIASYAFYKCNRLTSATIGDSVTTIGSYAFYDCPSLTSVYCKATTPPSLVGTAVFDNNGSGRKIYVPTGSVNAYKSATNWSEYRSAIVGYNF